MPKVKVLSPNAKDENEYLEIAARLGELSALMMYQGKESMSEREWKEASVYLTARRIYDVFSIYARDHNRGMYLTWQELQAEMRGFTNLDDGINYLLNKGLIRQEFSDIS
jgi:hypothetical protein